MCIFAKENTIRLWKCSGVLEKTGNDDSIADEIAEMKSGSVSDSAGHVRRMNTYDGDGNLIWYHTYTYNEQGQGASITSFDGAGNQTEHVDEVYTEDGDSLISYCYARSTGEVGKLACEYDDAGNEVRNILHSSEGESETMRNNALRRENSCLTTLAHTMEQDARAE